MDGLENEYRNNGINTDLALNLALPDTVITLICEIKNSGQPRLAREAVNQMLQYKEKIPNALTGFSGAARIAPATRYAKAMIYV